MAIKRFARAMEFRALWSEYGTTANSAVGGEVNYSMGLKAAIKDPQRGGIYTPLTNVMTQADFENFILRVANQQGVATTNLTLLVGRGALKLIQGFTSDYIKYAGKDNTFGGETVQGLDVYNYDIAGVHCKLVMLPIFNDQERFGTMSSIAGTGAFTRLMYTVVILDTNQYESVGGGVMLPAMEKVHFGGQEISYDYLTGVAMGQGSSTPSTGSITGRPFGAVNDRDGVSFQIYSDCAYDFMANKMGWLELAY